jgi:two-component system response regulator FixJ
MDPMTRDVHIVDDDADTREILTLLLESAGFRCFRHESAEALAASWTPDMAGCVLLDVLMPGVGGIELLRWLQARRSLLAVVVLTGEGHTQLAVQAIKAGALEFLEKPCDSATVVRVVESAVEESAGRARAAQARRTLRETHQRLSPREREVMALVCQGLANKSIGPMLGIAHRTVEAHRAQVMAKMGASSLAQLVKMQMTLNEGDDAAP